MPYACNAVCVKMNLLLQCPDFNGVATSRNKVAIGHS